MTTRTARRPKGLPIGDETPSSNGTGVKGDGDAEKLSELLAEFGTGGFQARLSRANPRVPSGWEYIGSLPFTHDLLEEIQHEFGGGTFRARIVDGVNAYRGSVPPFAIAGEPRAARAEAAAKEAAPPTAPTRDPVEVVTKIAAAAAPVLAAFGGLVKLFAARDSGGDVIGTMKLVNDAYDRGKADGRELGELSAERGDATGRSIADVISENLPQLIGVVAKEQAHRAQLPPAPTVPPSPPAPPTVPTTPLPAGYEWLASFRPFFPLLAKRAELGLDDADIVADLAVVQMTDELLGQIALAAERPDFDAVVIGAIPGIARADWLASFVARVKASALHDELEA